MADGVGRGTRRRWRQSRWLLWYFLTKEKCVFCSNPLIEGFDPKKVNVTLHHLDGSREDDDMDGPCPIDKIAPAHASCHRRWHMRERMAANGVAGAVESLREYTDARLRDHVVALVEYWDGQHEDEAVEFLDGGDCKAASEAAG